MISGERTKMQSLLSAPVDFQADRAKLFARAPAKIFFGHIGSACALIYLAFDVLAFHWLVLWGIWEIVVTPMLLYHLGKRAEFAEQDSMDLGRWQRQLHGLFLMVGVSWGAFVFFGLDIANSAHFSMQMAIVAGASAAAARSLGIFKFSFFFYEIPFTGLLALRIFTMGGDFALLGVLVIIFMILMCGLANDTGEELSEYLATKLENLDLAEKYRAAATEADRANLAKTQFLAQANHDLRQPIHAIALLTECLRDQPMDKEGDEILDTIDSSVENLAKLFKSLLNITSLDAGGLTPEISTFSLDELLRQTARQAQPEATERGCSLNFAKTSLWVRTDKALLGSILQNLVSNAIKYAPNTKILVGVRRQNGTAGIHVLDQGSGVPSYLLNTIFDEFVRGNPHGPGRTDGLGLGLSIVARTAKILDLKVDFQSIEETGTHVSVSRLSIVAPAKTKNALSANHHNATSNGEKILIVDDNPQVLMGMEKLLQKWGYDVVSRTPGDDFPTEIDIVLMDFHLNSTTTGIALSKELALEAGRQIPTIIISGTISAQMEDEAKKAGFWTLHKPVSPLQLRSILLAMDTDRAKKIPVVTDLNYAVRDSKGRSC